MSEKIIVIGGGISGLTTALSLQLLGHDTEIITDQNVTDADKQTHPEFASLYPSASIIPHSVYSDRLEKLFKKSQTIFYELRKLTFPGVTIHKHYEIFEDNLEQPDYCRWMLNLQSFDQLDPERVPRRPEVDELYGWAFDCIFADWDMYLPALYKLYNQLEGTITTQRLTSSDIPSLPAEIIINCSGTGSVELFDDPSQEQLLLRGHLLHKPDAPLITNTEGAIISYNYTPESSIYADSDGNACDVYCYPRKDGWILGGSRQSGQLTTSQWNETANESDQYKIDGISFPRQIIDLNQEILGHTYGKSLDKSDKLTPQVGYRYIRNRVNGLRMDTEKLSNKKIIHNYGHGGAGVTLSWGCALDIAKRITQRDQSELESELLTQIEQQISTLD